MFSVCPPGATGRQRLLLAGAQQVSEVSFTPDGHTLATAGADGRVILWDTTDPAAPRQLDVPLTGHTGGAYAVSFTPDGHTLATAGADGRVILWDLTGLEGSAPTRWSEPAPSPPVAWTAPSGTATSRDWSTSMSART